MNQQQRKYARERIECIFKVKCEAARAKYTTAGKSLTSQERLKLLKSGAIKLKKCASEISTYTKVVDVFDFSKYQSKSEFNVDAYEKLKAHIVKEKNKIMDELMLGDAEKAIQLIEKFQAD